MEQYLNVTQIGSNICVRGIDNDNLRFAEKIPYAPYAYVESPTDTPYKSMFGKSLKRKDFNSISEYRSFKKECNSVDIDVYGMDNIVCQFMTDNYGHDYDIDNVRVFYIDIENLMVDENGERFGIDPVNAPGAITAITIYDTLTKTYHMFGDHVWENNDYEHLKVEYHHADDEPDLLKRFIKFWKQNFPDIVTGWNSEQYDIPYIVNRITRVFNENTANSLSPWGKINKREYINEKAQEVLEYKIVGISCLDYIQIYKKNTFHKQESYKLDFIAQAELGKGKVDYRDHGYKDLDDLYYRNYQMYLDYNIRDVESIVQIDDKNKFMGIVIGIAHYSIINYDEVYSVLRCWDAIRHTYLKEHNIITSPRSRNEKIDKFAGAYVKEPIPNKYKWVMTFDLSSLYPSIIMTCNIGDETLVEFNDLPEPLQYLSASTVPYKKYDLSTAILNDKITEEEHQALVDNNLSMAANGVFYRNDKQSVQSILCDDILSKRKVFKNDMLKYKDEYERAKTAHADESELKRLNDLVTMNMNNQLVVKVLANSLYGAMGNQYDRYFDLRLAEAVTLTGQTIIKWAEKKVNGYLNKVLETDDVKYCIYSDTDSIFVNMEPMVVQLELENDKDKIVDFLNKVGDQINVKLTEFYDELGDVLNTTNNRMNMKREVISSASIFRTKKNYAMKVWDNEGVRYDEPDYKVMGMEVVRSTTPKYVREKLKHVLVMMLSDCTRDELLDYVADVRESYMKHDVIEDIAFPRGTNDLDSWKDEKRIYRKGAQIHIRGALLFNHYYAKDGGEIKGGDDVRYFYLKLPNPINENGISFKDEMPPELIPYIDHRLNFEKIFENPVKSLADIIGWSMHNTASLADLLG